MNVDRLVEELEFDEAVERAYRAAELAERAGNLRDAAVLFRVAADQRLGDAPVRMARVLFALGQVEEATRWSQVAREDGFTADLVTTDVKARQRFLEHAARITVGAPTFDWVPGEAPSVRQVSLADVQRVEARTRALRALDRQYGGIACHAAVLEHLAAVGPLVLADGAQAEMCRAVASVHELAGWTAFDAGQPGAALTHFAHALSLAHQDEGLIASVLSRVGQMFLHHNAPNDALKAFQLGFVAAHEAWVFRSLPADPAGATTSLATMVNTFGADRVRARTITLTALARTHLALGEREAALTFGTQALTTATNLRSVRADDQLRWLDQEAQDAGMSALVEQISARFARRS